MSKPLIHAQSSVKKFGGEIKDYIEIHNLMDSSKGAIADSRHRCLTHTSWFLSVILERIFGVFIVNSEGRQVSVRDIGEQHILEDFRGKFIPTAQDYLQEMEIRDWMNNGNGTPPSSERLYRHKRKETEELPVVPDNTLPAPPPWELPKKEGPLYPWEQPFPQKRDPHWPHNRPYIID